MREFLFLLFGMLLGSFVEHQLSTADRSPGAETVSISPEACSTLCDGAVVAWAPDSCVCDVQPGEIVWGAL